MKIQFLGASGTVTGSRYLLSHGETKILLDCGLFQGFKNLRLKNRDPFPVDLEKLDAVVLTHAHIDHSGYVPLLVKNGYRGPIYTTPPTVDLCEIMLPDSGFLQEEEARFANLHGFSKHHPALPLYTMDDAKESLKYFKAVPWGAVTRVSKGGLGTFEFQLFPAGHLLGAASVRVKTEGGSIIFSGDLGRSNDPMVRDPEIPDAADELVVESTYGNRKHPDRDPQEELREIITRTIQRKGIVLIPSFAVGRAQLILYYVHRLKEAGKIPGDLPVYLNSPMAAEANKAFAAHLDELKISEAELNSLWKSVRVISSPEESKALNARTEPAVIIAASGMATGGRVLHHLKSIAPDPKNTILFVGFQAGGTRGDLMVRGAEQIKIHGQYWPIRAELVNLETLSAHADADGILKWISALKRKPKRVFVTHGEPEAADTLRHRIEEELGLRALVPEHGQEFKLL